MQGGQPVSPLAANYSTVCPASSMPATSHACSATGCRPVVWQVGAWSPCSAGTMNRTLGCTVLNGGAVGLSVRILLPDADVTASSSAACQGAQQQLTLAVRSAMRCRDEMQYWSLHSQRLDEAKG